MPLLHHLSIHAHAPTYLLLSIYLHSWQAFCCRYCYTKSNTYSRVLAKSLCLVAICEGHYGAFLMLLLLEERSCSEDAVGARVKPILFAYSSGTRMETYILLLFPRAFATTRKALTTRAFSLRLVPPPWTLWPKTFLGTSLLETVFGAIDSLTSRQAYHSNHCSV